MPETLIINDSNFRQFVAPTVDGHRTRRGLKPRDYSAHPVGCYSSSKPFDEEVPLIPMEQWPDIISEQERTKSRLMDVIEDITPLDQNGQGFCWAYSTVMGLMINRRVANLPDVRLSPHGVACKQFGFEDRGAWGALSFDFVSKYGCPPESHWPQKSMRREHDNPMTWEEAEKYKLTEGFIDLEVSHPADAELSVKQTGSCLLQLIPAVADYNWWGHSVIAIGLKDHNPRLPATNPMRYGVWILNSWGNSWGERGRGLLTENKAWPNGGCAPRSVVAA